MKKLIIFLFLLASACSTQPASHKTRESVDSCMTKEESRAYLSSHFNGPLHPEVSTSTAGALAVLLSAAIDGRFGKHIDANEVHSILIKKSGSESAVNMLHMKYTVEELGFGAVAFRGNAQDYRKYKKVMALAVGLSPFLISGVENDIVYTVNPNGMVCRTDYRTFRESVITTPVMFLKSRT